MKSNYLMKLGFIFLLAFPASAQQLFTASHKENSVYKSKAVKEIYITGERCEIQIVGTDDENIKLEIIYISKNSNAAQAEKDLKLLQLNQKIKSQTLYLNAATIIKNAEQKPKSGLSIKLMAYVPKDLNIQIRNRVGKVDIEGMDSKKVFIDHEFCLLHIVNSKMNAEILQKYGECKIESSEFNGFIQFNHTIVDLHSSKGNISMKGSSGKLAIITNSGGLHLEASLEKVFCILGGDMLNSHQVQADKKTGKWLISSLFNFKPQTEDGWYIHGAADKKKLGLIKISNIEGITQIGL